MILGIDTSNYTTSLCLIDEAGAVVAEARQILRVDEGERGLQQSAAVFQHVQNLPRLLEQMSSSQYRISAVTVSTRPRPKDGSYMPVFTVGASWARSIAALLEVPCYETSHQEGHIAAGEATTGQVPVDEFIAVHLSGGTSDILHIQRVQAGYTIDLLGTSTDLHAGQFVDRVGVALGLTFPTGPALEILARKQDENHENESVRLPSPVNGYDLSFAGPETAAMRLVAQGIQPSAIARAVESCIAKGLEKALLHVMRDLDLRDILIVGGVASNRYIRTRLQHRLEHPSVKARLYFAEPRYSVDNALGVATIGLRMQNNVEKK